MTRRFGFTLAEVLITLTIIGVIAAMTIPTLLSNTSDQEYKTGLKKAISTINQAITMQYALEGTTMNEYYINADATGGVTGGANTIFDDENGIIGAVFEQRMQVVSTTDNRGGQTTTATGGGDPVAAGNNAVYLSDGMVIEFPAAKGTGCGNKTDGCLATLVVDVNGDKGKCTISKKTAEDVENAGGKLHVNDCFILHVYEDGVRPGNYAAEQVMYAGK